MTRMIEYNFWLTFDRDGLTPKATRNAPSLKPAERSMRCQVVLPETLFKQPSLTATITVDEPPAKELSFDLKAASDALREVVGAEVVFNVRPAEEPAS